VLMEKVAGTASLGAIDLANLQANATTGTLTIGGSGSYPATASSSPLLTLSTAAPLTSTQVASNLVLDFNRIALDNNLTLASGKTLTLRSQAGVSQATGKTLSAENLLLSGSGNVALGVGQVVTTLASNTTGSIAMGVTAAPLTIGTVAGVSGIHNASGVSVTGAQSILIDQSVSASGNITLAGGNGLTAGATSNGIIIASVARVISNGGDVILDAGMAGNFINNRGADAVKAGGKWQVWAAGLDDGQ